MARKRAIKDESKVNPTDFKDSILECLSNKKLYEFVRWYCESDQTKESYDAIKGNLVEYEYALSNHLTRADVQQAIKLWFKKTKDLNMLKVYSVMLNKALNDADVKSADWLSKFNNSNFFEDDVESEMATFIGGLNIDISKSNEGDANE